jgi:group I intron endonuclease
MKTRQDLKREYKERKRPAGVFVIRNTANGKVFLGSSLNLEGPLNRHRFMLSIGKHEVPALQKDWNTFGSGSFTFEILEEVKEKDTPGFSVEDELTLLEQIWVEALQPFGDTGYNVGKRIRYA